MLINNANIILANEETELSLLAIEREKFQLLFHSYEE